jgi:hypothetical protein
MTDLFETEIKIYPGRKIAGHVSSLFEAKGGDFATTRTDALELTFDGIIGDFHGGATRKSGGREPWYPRGTEMRNERQISILATNELQRVAAGMGLAQLEPDWIGGNMVIDEIASLSMLPAGTLLFFEGGVTLKVDGQNGPCKLSGRSIAEHIKAADPVATALDFVRVAKRMRGLVAWVEKPGIIRAGEKVNARLPEQWIYQP